MSKLIPENELHGVLDSSKIQNYMHCPRKYFFEHILGWRSDQANVHLEFGTAWHMLMEVIYEKGFAPDVLAEAYQVFYDQYSEFFGPEHAEANKPKTPDNVLRALPQYAAKYADADDFEVLHIEVAGSVEIAPDRLLHFKTDTICQGDQGYFSLEHKSGSYFGATWSAQWRQKMQTGTYSHVLHSMYPNDEVYGVIINGAFFHAPPKMTKDGRPYANSRDNEFHRVPVRRNLQQMDEWLAQANHWVDMIERDHAALEDETDEQTSMNSFQKNTESCTKYGVCPFMDHCSVWSNPLQHVGEMPEGYKSEHWDPRNQPTAREVVEL